jgi:hypothetical protein
VSETLFEYRGTIRSAAGELFRARACGAPLDATVWEGWLEFDPVDGGDSIRSRRETTQPNRTDAIYWASGLSTVYLQGSLARALEGPVISPRESPRPPAFDEPAPSMTGAASSEGKAVRSVLDPFSVYEKGEALLRTQLSALSAWHLINIVRDYDLDDASDDALNAMPAPVLIDMIVRGVKQGTAAR